MFDLSVQLGSLTLPNRAILAPLAGVSDVPFRRICQEFGAGLTYVEMLSAAAVNMNGKRTMEMMARHPSETILGVQVTGSAEDVAKAVEKLDRAGFDTIDINMGCPVRKIVGSGWGSGFLKDPDRISRTVAMSRAATRKPLTVKFRLGFNRPECSVTDTVRRVREGGADGLTIHGRFRSDDYSVAVDPSLMAAGFAGAGPLLKVGNGDVMDVASARRLVEAGADAVMVSRGALGNPWIFREIVTGKKIVPTLAEWKDVVLRHIQYHEDFYGDHELSARRIRKHLIWFASGFPKANRERAHFNVVASLQQAREHVKAFAASLPPNLLRYENPDHDHRAYADPKYQMDREADAAVADS